MKSHEFLTKKPTLPKNFKQLLILSLSFTFLVILPLSLLKITHTKFVISIGLINSANKKCDIFRGKWIYFTRDPYYTNTSCKSMIDQVNCMKGGRPDTDYTNWRWKPNDCELPMFDPVEFLEIVRGKSLAFVSDSLGRNQIQSLLCLLSKVSESKLEADSNMHRHVFTDYNFTIAKFSSPYLVKSRSTDPNGFSLNSRMSIYLDEPDEKWSNNIQSFDYVIISGGTWFFRPLIYYEKGKIVGCLNCGLQNITQVSGYFGYRKALKTAFKTLNELKNFKGVTFLRTFSPGHFENGVWNTNGSCLRKKPFSKEELKTNEFVRDMYSTQVEEFRVIERESKKNRGFKSRGFRLMSITEAMWMRPDGHPNSYGPSRNSGFNDCVHWCLPGPVDLWNEILLYMFKNED